MAKKQGYNARKVAKATRKPKGSYGFGK